MVLLLAPIVTVIIAVVALALAFLARSIAAPFINFFSRQLSTFLKPIDWLVNRMIDLAIELTHNIAPAFENGVKPLVGWIHALGQLSEYTAHAIYRNALQLNSFAHWVVHHYIPTQLRAVTGHAVSTTLVKVRTVPFTAAQRRTLQRTIEADLLRKMEAAIPGVVAKPYPRINWTPRQWRRWLGLGAAGGALALPGATAWEREYAKTQGKINSTTHKRLAKMNWLLAFAGAGTLVLAGLNKLGLQWVRCPNVGRLGRVVCRAPAHWLDDILGLITDFLILTDICQVLPLLEDGLKAVEPLLVEFTTGASAIVCRDSHPKPGPLSIPTLRLPSGVVGLPTLQLP